jgi:hypothetical protein
VLISTAKMSLTPLSFKTPIATGQVDRLKRDTKGRHHER